MIKETEDFIGPFVCDLPICETEDEDKHRKEKTGSEKSEIPPLLGNKFPGHYCNILTPE